MVPTSFMSEGEELMKHILAMVAFVAAASISAVAANGQEAALSGRWTQASNERELVLLPKIKLQPMSAYPMAPALAGPPGTDR
jgi:hypothetical protein